MAWNLQVPQEQLAFLMEAGLICRDAKRFQEAGQIFAGVHALAPKSEVPEVALGTLCFAQGDLDGAFKHYRHALALNPKSAWAIVHLGEACLARGEREEARAQWKKALDLDPRGEHGELARSLLGFLDAPKKPERS
jgi:tetratricopeptide (TPR) repeat protein